MPHEARPKKTRTSAGARRKNVAAPKARPRPEHRREIGARVGSGGDIRRALGTVRGEDALVRLLEAFEAEKIRYVMIGMSAAIAQGVMTTTLDIDIWIDLPARQYMRVLNLARGLSATIGANTVVYLEDGTPVNFVYEVTGLGKFAAENKRARKVSIAGHRTPVLSLEKIVQSKEAIGRDKDKLHITQIQEFLRCRGALKRGR